MRSVVLCVHVYLALVVIVHECFLALVAVKTLLVGVQFVELLVLQREQVRVGVLLHYARGTEVQIAHIVELLVVLVVVIVVIRI